MTVVPLTRKERLRAETEKLVAAYDGPINRGAGHRVQIRCNCCSLVAMVDVARVVAYKQVCYRCGSRDVAAVW